MKLPEWLRSLRGHNGRDAQMECVVLIVQVVLLIALVATHVWFSR